MIDFLAFEKDNSTVSFSAGASQFLNLKEGMNILWHQSEEEPFMWQFALTRNTIQTTPLMNVRVSNQWRFNDISIVNQVCQSFNIKSGSRVRLFIDREYLVKEQTHKYGDINWYRIVDLPWLRDDFANETEKAEYIKRYRDFIERNKRLPEQYGFTDEELDFMKNNDIKYRMGKGSELFQQETE